jgi:hypothetical protein
MMFPILFTTGGTTGSGKISNDPLLMPVSANKSKYAEGSMIGFS